MLHLIDVDTEYEMQERAEIKELSGKNELLVEEHRSAVSEGILLSDCITTIHMKVTAAGDSAFDEPMPSMILFDSLDGRIHDEEREIRDLVYLEYGEISFNGQYVLANARKILTFHAMSLPTARLVWHCPPYGLPFL